MFEKENVQVTDSSGPGGKIRPSSPQQNSPAPPGGPEVFPD